MQYLKERVAYLKGLADGLGIDTSSKEGKMLSAIVDVLEDVVEAMDYGPEADYDEDFTYRCPNCNEPIQVDETALTASEQIICPKCNETILIETHEI